MTQRSLLVALLLLAGCSRAHEVDPTGGVGTEHLRLRVAQLRLVADPTGPTPLRLVASDKRTSVLADVSLSGPGVWDPATERLSAEVRITNHAPSPLDEPDMVVTSITEVGPDGGAGPAVVRVELHDFDGDRVGSAFRFADLDLAGGVNGGSARHPMRFHAPGGVPFSFTVDVFAYVNAPAGDIHPDADDDGYNSEPGVRGEDCDDSDPSVYPGVGGCLCLEDCSACGAGGCCQTTCQGDCGCPSGCDCDFEPGDGGGTEVGCEGATCSLRCGASGGACTIDTCVDSSCAIECAGTTGTCRVASCLDSSCDIQCQGNEGKCSLGSCEASTCHLSCVEAEAKCAIESCGAGSHCQLLCQSTASACQLACEAGASCVLTCVDAPGCQLTCAGGAPVDCGGGVQACAAADCP